MGWAARSHSRYDIEAVKQTACIRLISRRFAPNGTSLWPQMATAIFSRSSTNISGQGRCSVNSVARVNPLDQDESARS